MDERKKLDEAKYFYKHMNNVIGKSLEFAYNLDAFLTAARSVMQFLYDEVKTKSSQKEWYENLYSEKKILGYFRDKRNYTVHERQLVPNQKIKVSITEFITVVPEIKIDFYRVDSEGNRIEENLNRGEDQNNKQIDKQENVQKSKLVNIDEQIAQMPKPSSSVTYEYRFDDWPGTEDIIELSKLYIDDLENILTRIGK